ncbi:ABC transporter substrate binding protein [Pseudodesulfovibrio sp.]|uniref:ABC transporter substrate binding protein n=1 Tax=unclassified Pseudodesulfovibrio TaxID=2661612 RepID=UPI003B00B3DE
MGVIAAYAVYGEEHGYLAGQMVSRLLEGEPARQFSVQDDPQGISVFNKHQLDRYGLVIPDAILQPRRGSPAYRFPGECP